MTITYFFPQCRRTLESCSGTRVAPVATLSLKIPRQFPDSDHGWKVINRRKNVLTPSLLGKRIAARDFERLIARVALESLSVGRTRKQPHGSRHAARCDPSLTLQSYFPWAKLQ